MSTKRKMPISIRFARRPGYDTLQIRITIDGHEGSAFSTTSEKKTIQLAGVWDQKKQRRTDRTDAAITFNTNLDKLRAVITAVYEDQIKCNLTPTPKSVQLQYQTGVSPAPKPAEWTLIESQKAYYIQLKANQGYEDGLNKATLIIWKYGLNYLISYLTPIQQKLDLSNKLRTTTTPVDKVVMEVTVPWMKKYHRWLMSEGPMKPDAATRYCNQVWDAVDYLVQEGELPHHPFVSLRLPGRKAVPVRYLDAQQLALFWAYSPPAKLFASWWWMGLIFLTGLDLPDARRYIARRDLYEEVTPWGRKIVIKRNKTGSECHIPMLPELEKLLECVPTGKVPSGLRIRTDMKKVANAIGFTTPLTPKIGRKTAGSMFFARYGNIGGVSKVLGHSRVAMTEAHYLKTDGNTVNQMMEIGFKITP